MARLRNYYQGRIIRTFSEVETVFGTIGESDSATDNAPLDTYDTTTMPKPREKWRPGMNYEKLTQEMDAKLQFPGLSNTWTMPVREPLGLDRNQNSAGDEKRKEAKDVCN